MLTYKLYNIYIYIYIYLYKLDRYIDRQIDRERYIAFCHFILIFL